MAHLDEERRRFVLLLSSSFEMDSGGGLVSELALLSSRNTGLTATTTKTGWRFSGRKALM